MNLTQPILQISRLLAATCLLAGVSASLADVLIQHNGEKLVGKVVEEGTEQVVFESETFGRMTVPRSRIRELQRSAPATAATTNQVPTQAASGVTTNVPWRPDGIGKDGFDWLQLKTGEWLKGHLRDLRNDKVKFESEKLEDLTFDFSDVPYLYCANPMFTKFEGREQIYNGGVIITTNKVEVLGAEALDMPRDQLTGVSPAGKREIDLWSARASVGMNFQSGNTKQVTINSSAEVTRRTPATQFLLNYLGNYSEAEGTQNANNHRINLSYDVRLNRNWFVRPVQAEYYRDQLANIAHRLTAGIGVGYYLLDREGLEWKVAAGPGYQYTRFSTVAPGDSDTASTPAAMLQSEFEADITSRLTFIQLFSSTLASQDAGLYSHHWVSTLEFELKKALDLNFSFVWDFIQNPQTEASGTVPQRSDVRVTLGIGVKF